MNKTKKKKKIKLINDLTNNDINDTQCEWSGVKATYNKQGSMPSFCSEISKDSSNNNNLKDTEEIVEEKTVFYDEKTSGIIGKSNDDVKIEIEDDNKVIKNDKKKQC